MAKKKKKVHSYDFLHLCILPCSSWLSTNLSIFMQFFSRQIRTVSSVWAKVASFGPRDLSAETSPARIRWSVIMAPGGDALTVFNRFLLTPLGPSFPSVSNSKYRRPRDNKKAAERMDIFVFQKTYVFCLKVVLAVKRNKMKRKAR